MERFQPPSIQLAFTRHALLERQEEIALQPLKKPFGVTIVAQLDLPALNMERVCVLLDQYATLTRSHHMYLELNPEHDEHVTTALRQVSSHIRLSASWRLTHEQLFPVWQFRAVCMRYPSLITINLRFPRYYEIEAPLLPEIENMRQFYRCQPLSRYITSKRSLFSAEGNTFYIDYDPAKNTLISRSVREGEVQ